MQRKTKHYILLSLLPIGMFGFAYLMVPFYNVMCKALNINGKPSLIASQDHSSYIDYSRTVTLEFLATTNNSLDWEFHPQQEKITVSPGADNKVAYYARNNTDHEITIQAIPSLSPGEGARHIHKTQCFCFTKQTLKAHQAMIMPIVFHFDTDLPKNIHEVSLSYTIFQVKRPAIPDEHLSH